MRSVEVAVGLTNHTWTSIWVDVPHEPDTELDLEDDEAAERAEEMALESAAQAGYAVSFIKVIYMAPLEDPLEGII